MTRYGIDELESLQRYVEECEQIGQGVNSKESVRIRFLSLFADAPTALSCSDVCALLGLPSTSVGPILGSFEEKGWLRSLKDGYYILTGGSLDTMVTCKFCTQEVPAATAHLHQGQWVGDACCWDERLRSTS